MLSELYKQGLEIIEPLLNSIELKKLEITKNRFETIYWRTEIYDITNNHEIIWKKYDEIETDLNYFSETSERAKKLKEIITTANKSYKA